jgi:hypothetical protein
MMAALPPSQPSLPMPPPGKALHLTGSGAGHSSVEAQIPCDPRLMLVPETVRPAVPGCGQERGTGDGYNYLH